MRCPRCHHDNPDIDLICGACATPLEGPRHCLACGFPNPAKRRDCLGCGSALEGPAPAPLMRERAPVDPRSVRYPPARDVGDVGVLRRDYDKLRAAYATAQAMSLAGGLDGLFAQIIDTALEVLEADRAAILLIEPDGRTPTLRFARQRDGRAADVPLSQTILREVVDGRVGIISADVGADERFLAAASIRLGDIRSAMCVPMVQGDDVLGVLHCDTRLTRGAFESDDLALFTTIATQAAVAVRNGLLLDRIRDETQRRVQLQRFFSPNVIDRITDGRIDVGAGELTSLVVYFLDIRGFTRMAEGMPPTAVVEVLNAFFEEMVEVLFAHDGTLDKYVGDQLMALFGAPSPLPDAAMAAVRCALAMQHRLDEFNARGRAIDRPTLQVGIGIHSGQAVCGIVGSSRAGQYTAIGDTVNTAARLCERATAGQIVISEPLWESVRDCVDVEPLAPTQLKGKDRPLRLYNVSRAR